MRIYVENKIRNSGFSLVELMVVIAIVGILIALVYVNFQEARSSARDKVRQTTLVDIQLALESYKAQTSSYPLAGCGSPLQWVTKDASASAALGAFACTSQQQMIEGIVPSYIGALPDPSRLEGVGYYYKSDGNAYKLIVYNRVESVANEISEYASKFAACPNACTGQGHPFCDGSRPDSRSYGVYSPGGECF